METTVPERVPGAPATTGPGGGARPGPGQASILHAVCMFAGFALLLVLTRHQWFVSDEWDFLTDRSPRSLRALLIPHNEHWSTVPILVFRLLLSTVGLHSYVPYMAIALVVHVGVAHLLWRLLRRAGADPWIAVTFSVLFVLFGAGAENFLTAFGMTFSGAVLLGLWQLLLVDHPGPFDRRDLAGVALSLVNVMVSGVALTMIAVAGLTVLLRRGWRAATATVAPPALLFLAWLATPMGREALHADSGHLTPARIPYFVARGYAYAVDIPTGVKGVSVAVLAALAVWFLRHRREVRGRLAVATACAAGVGLFLAVAGLGRAGFGVGFAATSRYVYVTGALLALPAGLALSDVTRRRLVGRIAAVAVLVAVTANGTRLLLRRAGEEAFIEGQVRRVVLAAAQLDVTPAQVISLVPEPRFSPNLRFHQLLAMRDRGRLPPARDVSRVDELTALSAMQSRMTTSPLLPYSPSREAPGRPVPLVLAGVRAIPADEGCTRFEPLTQGPQLLLLVPVPTALQVRHTDGALAVFLRDPDGTTAAIANVFVMQPAGPGPQPSGRPPAPGGPGPQAPEEAQGTDYLNLNVRDQQVILGLPTGVPVTLCGLAQPDR